MNFEIPAKLFGLTIDSIDEDNLGHIIRLLNEFRRANDDFRPTVRIVFDPGENAERFNEKYAPRRIKQLKDETGVFLMGEILDSSDIHKCVKRTLPPEESVNSYRRRTEVYLEKLDSLIDIWEIGNEVNGEWTGWDGDPSADRSVTAAEMRSVRNIVVRQCGAALDIIQAAGKKTALTIYFNDDGNGKTSYATNLKRESPDNNNEVAFGVEHGMFR